eukprot:SAG31_NODE_48_length_30945_cov_16.254263_10_plen_134_part_00
MVSDLTDAASDRAAGVDLLGHVVGALDVTVLSNGSVRVHVQAGAVAAHVREGGARAADVLRCAGEVGARAESFLGLLGASAERAPTRVSCGSAVGQTRTGYSKIILASVGFSKTILCSLTKEEETHRYGLQVS